MNDSSNRAGMFARIRTVLLVAGGMILVFFGFTRLHQSNRDNAYTATMDGVAHADAPSSGDSGGGSGDSGGGSGDSGGC